MNNQQSKISKLIESTLKETIKEAGQMGDVAWASDGGYYTKPEHKVIVTRQEADEIKKITDEMYNDLFVDKDEYVMITGEDRRENSLKYNIIKQLQKDFELDHDSEEGTDYYWITKEEDIPLAKEEFKAIVDNLYDKIQESKNLNKNRVKLKESCSLLFEKLNYTIQGYPFYWNKKENRFEVESSDLGLKPQYWNSLVKVPVEKEIELTNKDKGTWSKFIFDKPVTYGEDEEVGAWIYKNDQGVELHIIND